MIFFHSMHATAKQKIIMEYTTVADKNFIRDDKS